MTIAIRGVRKSFKEFVALDSVSLEVKEGEVLALLGPSGSGKTTLLRIIAGLESEDEGQVLFFGEDMAGVSVRDRRVGFVFQHYALFRHMSVFDNVAFGLKVRRDRPSKSEIERRVLELLHLVQLDPFADRRPSQLSGGQRQRVALARALAIEPKVLLLDEPFGALDAQVRKDLRRWLRRLHDEIGVTSVFVTHDQDEALEIADRVVVMSHGKIEQIASPTEVYDAPATPFVFEFIGGGNRLAAVARHGALDVAGVTVATPAGVSLSEGQAINVFVRPGDLGLAPADGGSRPAWTGTVRHLARLGPLIRAQIATPFGMMEAEASRETAGVDALSVGAPVVLRPRRLWMFDGGAAIRIDG